jgi:two-component system NtrC family sensor kinase
MKGLTARVVLAVAAAAVVGLLVAEVTFVFWAAGRYAAQDRAELRQALAEVAAAGELTAGADAAAIGALLTRVGVRHGVALTLIDASGTRLRGGQPDDPEVTDPLGARVESLPLERGRWRQLHAARPARLAVVQALSAGGVAALVLVVAGLLTVGFATAFLRRGLLAPLSRVTELVRRQELDALTRLAAEGGDDVSTLGRAIIGLNQSLADDRARLAAQRDELAAKNEALERAQRELSRAQRLATVGQLAAGLAHEVGNPLAVLSGYVDMLREGTLGEGERRDALSRMSKELLRIQGTLRELLDFSRVPPRAGPEDGDLAAAITHVRALIGPQLRGARLELGPLPATLPVALTTDAATQLVLNLVLNALDAAGPGGRLAVSVESAAMGPLVVHVDDSGAGVPVDLRTRIFEPFFTTKPAGRGTGLGLSVCERIVATAGGDLRVSDGPLGGARFSASLPRPAGRSA